MRIAMSFVLALIAVAAAVLYFFGKPAAPVLRTEPVSSAPAPQPSLPSPPEPQPTPAPAQPSAQPSPQPGPDQSNLPPSPSLPSLPVAQWTSVEQRIFELTNAERAKAGLKPLQREDGLHECARAQSADMLARHFFDHVNPSGEDPSGRIGRIHRRLIGTAGENIWKGSGAYLISNADLAGLIVQAWMNSPHHRENILRPAFTHLGVGVVIENEEVRATQNFSGVKAYLKTPLPATLPTGAPLSLATDGPAPRFFDLQPAGGEAAPSKPAPVDNARVAVSPGSYRIRFYFPESGKGSFSIFEGPQIAIR